MVKKNVIREIDKTIKSVWKEEIAADYFEHYLLREDSLKSALYYHLRNKLDALLYENNLRIYTEFWISSLKYRADMVIVEIADDVDEYDWLADAVTDIVAIIELKFKSEKDDGTAEEIKNDIWKFKDYVQQAGLTKTQFYFGVIYEVDCAYLQWMDGRSINNWADGRVTELNAGRIDDEMLFEVHSYNGMNKSLNDRGAVSSE